MDEYDEVEDIEALLRSAVRGDSTNNTSSTADDEQQPVAEDSATRRRRIRLGDNAFGSLHPLSEEQQADEERAALLNAAIPERSRTPLQKKTQTRIDQDLWKHCDRGIAAQRRLTGTHVSWSSSQRVIFMLMQLIPITEFAPELYEWGPNKTKNATMVKLADTYAHMRPSIVKMLTDVTTSTGADARTLIDDAKQAIFGGETIHDISVYALMIYFCSTHTDSAKRQTVDTVLDDYLKTQDTDIEKLLTVTKKGKFLNIEDDVETALKGAWDLPGMKRLNYQENKDFTAAWLDLWSAVINILCFQEREKQDIGEVNKALNDFIIDTKDHADCRQKKPVHEVHTNRKMKFMKLAEDCKRMQMPERIPAKYSRAINFLAAVDDDTFRKLERVLEDADSIGDADMTYEKNVKLCLLAESRLKKRISAITMAKQLRGTNQPPDKKKKEPSDKDSESKDKKKEEKRKPPNKSDAFRACRAISRELCILMTNQAVQKSNSRNCIAIAPIREV